MNGLLNHLNSIRPTIKFTKELEEEGSLPFPANDITVYRKNTHTDRYLHFESHHPIHVKKGTVRCRARNLTRDDSVKEEESHLMKTFIENGYPRAFVQSASKQRTPREPDDDDNETERPPMARTWQALVRRSGRCAGTSTSERCLSPGPPSAAFSQRSKTPYRQPSNRTSSTRYHAPLVRCTLEKHG